MPTDPRCGGDEVLRDTEQQAADHGAADVADAAEHGGGERLDARDEAHRVGEHEGVAEQEAGRAGERPPMRKVREMVRSMSTPISAAVGASSAVARMPRPSLVPATSRSRKSISNRAETMITICSSLICAPKTVNRVLFLCR